MRCIQIALTILIRLWCICLHALLSCCYLLLAASMCVRLRACQCFDFVLFCCARRIVIFAHGTSSQVLVRLFLSSCDFFLWKIKKPANSEWERWQVQTETTKINWMELNGLDGESHFFFPFVFVGVFPFCECAIFFAVWFLYILSVMSFLSFILWHTHNTRKG